MEPKTRNNNLLIYFAAGTGSASDISSQFHSEWFLEHTRNVKNKNEHVQQGRALGML
jgi:hypothetical protein